MSLDEHLTELDQRMIELLESAKRNNQEMEASTVEREREMQEYQDKLERQADQLRMRINTYERDREALEREKILLDEKKNLLETEEIHIQMLWQQPRESNEGEAQRILDCVADLEAHKEALRQREEDIQRKEAEITAILKAWKERQKNWTKGKKK